MTAVYTGRVLPQGHAVWSIDYGLTDTEPMEIDTAKASDGDQQWRYEFSKTDYCHFAVGGNRAFLMHDSRVSALTTF